MAGSTPSTELSSNRERLRRQVAGIRSAIAHTVAPPGVDPPGVAPPLAPLVCRFRPDGSITFANAACGEHLGRGGDGILGRDFPTLLRQHDREAVRRDLRAMTPESPTVVFDPPGAAVVTGRAWRWTCHALFDDAGTVTGYQAMGEEISEACRAAAASRRARATLRGLLGGLATTGIGIHVLGPDHTILIENDMLAGRFGSGLGKKCYTHYRGQTEPCAECTAVNALAQGRLVSAEIVGGDGHHYRVFTAPLPETGQAAKSVLEVAVDITEHKRAEQALRESELRYRSLTDDVLDTSAAGILILDAGFRVVWINQATERFFGVRREDVLGHDKRVLLETDLRHTFADSGESAAKLLATYADNTYAERFECHVRPGEGREERWLEHSSSPIQSGLFAGGRIEHYYDITSRRRAEAERIDIERRMQHRQKLESLGLMAGGVAHDFNNLLMTMLGSADLALQDIPDSSPAHERVREIERGAQRAAELAGQLLAYAGRGRFVNQPVSLSHLIRDLEPMLRISASRKVSFALLLEEGLPAVDGDPAQIRQIALNLVTNAAEAIGDRDGSLTIRTGTTAGEESDDAAATVGEQGPTRPMVFLEVTDTGCGMDEETKNRVFDPFFTTKFTGRGLGMAAVMGIVRDHRGTIDIQSEPERGTRIRVLFPRSAKEVASPKPAPSIELGQGRNSGSGRPRRILLVDDEVDVLAIARHMLEGFGLEVLPAADGFQAVEIFRARADDIDCVLLDLTMPRMDGETTFRELREIRADARIVLTSGYSEQDISDRFADGSLAGFIQKPYCSASLKSVLERALAVR